MNDVKFLAAANASRHVRRYILACRMLLRSIAIYIWEYLEHERDTSTNTDIRHTRNIPGERELTLIAQLQNASIKFSTLPETIPSLIGTRHKPIYLNANILPGES